MATNRSRLVKWMLASAVTASLLLVVANSAIWANRNLFDTDQFTATASGAITSESSRRALATEITDRALADYPQLKNLVDDAAINFISGLLGTQRAEKLTTRAVSRLQVILTSPPRQEPVVINLEGIKDTLNRLIEISGREDEAKIDPAKLPDQLVLLEPRDIPNFNNLGVTLGWLSPLLVLAALALLIWPYFIKGARYLQIVMAQGGLLVLFGLLALAIGPLFRPKVLENVASANLRVVVGNLYDAFVASFNAQTFMLVLAGLLGIVIGASIYGYRVYRDTH